MAGRLGMALVLGSMAACLGGLASQLPVVGHLEEDWGLGLLFKLRGPRQPPADVVVVGIDKQSADEIGVPADPAKWPRSLHARLLDHLVQQGAAVIAFDIVFDQPGAVEDDESFGQAMRKSRNVVLGQYLARDILPITGSPGGQLLVETLLPPVAVLADAALAVAPFPLPKTPVRVSRYWTFKTSAGDTPTLPVVAFQIFALDAYDGFVRLLEEVNPYLAEKLPPDRRSLVDAGHLEGVVRLVRNILEHDPATVDRMLDRLRTATPPVADSRDNRLLRALLEMYRTPASPYLAFYGPPRSIRTISYSEVWQAGPATGPPGPSADLRGKAVFVGLSETARPNQKDGFYTVFSQPDGADLSGVEIAATAFANILEMGSVRPLALGWHVAVIVLWGLAVGALSSLLAPVVAGAAILAAGGLYVVGAARAFGADTVWYPVVVPLLQAGLAFLGAVLWTYRRTARERENVRRALGYYLPARVADEIARHVGDLRKPGDLAYGTCLTTDAHQYTTLAETMDPARLATLMNEYYAVLFEQVKRYGGIVSDVVGDSMVAIWATARPDAALRGQACCAALEIGAAVDRFNDRPDGIRLPTRIGLHSGPLVLANVGAIDHYEYRAVGDIVNTATRLEGLNKRLGTRVLVTEDVLHGLEHFTIREIGTFLLAGKSKPLQVYELMGRDPGAEPCQPAFAPAFAKGLAAFRAQRWDEAAACFATCLAASPEDGPSKFYARLCTEYAGTPPVGAWDAVIRIDSK